MSLDSNERTSPDRTELPRKDEELKRLRQIIDLIPDPIYFKDTESRFIDANTRMAELFGCESVEALHGKTDFDFCEQSLAEEYFADEQMLFQSGKPLRAKLENVYNESGELIHLLVSKTPTYDASGNINGLVGIGRNVTELTKARQQLTDQSEVLKEQNQILEKRRKELRTLIDNIPDFIYFKDTKSRYVNGNNKFYEGFSSPEMEPLVGKWDFDFFDKEHAQRFYDDEQEMFRTGTPVSKEEKGVNIHGKPFFLQTTKTPIYDPATGKPLGMVGISRDITDIKRAREELVAQAEDLRAQKDELSETLNKLKMAQVKLVQSEKMASLGVLTAGIAHEINNPINFVYAGVNSIVKDFEDVKAVVQKMRKLTHAANKDEAIEDLKASIVEHYFDDAFDALEETLKDIKLGATRITEIVAGLSKFSRLGRESWQLTNLHEDIDSVLVLLKNKYKMHISLERRYHPDFPAVECFPSKLNQAIMNIISNAIDAIDEKAKKGTIVISTNFDEKHVYLSIKDNGIGMSQEVRSKILDPFFTTKEIGKGVGLGLAITFSIIQDHQGELNIVTEEGEGSEFIITLPIKQN